MFSLWPTSEESEGPLLLAGLLRSVEGAPATPTGVAREAQSCRPATVPTPEEIERECEAIQREWSEAERIEGMRPDQRPIPWELPCVPFSGTPTE